MPPTGALYDPAGSLSCWVLGKLKNNDDSVAPFDFDGDGYAQDSDCDDGNAAVHPGALELCNGIDDDCDFKVDAEDEDVDATTWYPDSDEDLYGASSLLR
jgi:hypothetical protein